MNHTLTSFWLSTVEAAPNAAALTDAASGRVWTRRELDETAETWVRSHAPQGVATNRTIVFSERNGAAWFTSFLGILKSGGVAAPLDPGEPIAQQLAIARAIGASFLWNGTSLTELPLRPRHRDRRRLIKLTSGSTAAPRALAFTDAQMIADGRQVCRSMGIVSSDFNYALIPFGHSYGLGNLVVPLLIQGTAIVGGSAALPHVIASEIARYRPTIFPAVPALLRALTNAELDPDQLASLRTIISAGAPLESDIANAFHQKFGKLIHSFYGSSETGGITFDRSGTAALNARSVGTPLEGVRIEIARDRRVHVTSDAVFTIGNRRAAADHGSHRTGDLGTINSLGELVLLGRAGRMVKIAGRRLNLAEIEHTLRQLPDVHDAFATAHPDHADAIAAIVVSTQDPARFRDALRQRLASWKIPRKLIAIPKFPLTPRGKIDTRKLRELLQRLK
jgi:acyl-CoA synthetase (AMP-forming)/AMP-acid ligase II